MFDPTVLLLMLASNASAGPTPFSAPVVVLLATRQGPDTKKAKPLGRWANDRDIARLQSAKGKPHWIVLILLGHPSSVELRADGAEIWDYPWVAACRVWIKNGVCIGTFYTAGY